MVPVDYYNLKKEKEKKVSGTLPFICPVTALSVFYRRRLTLCTALSTWSPRFTRRNLYLRRRSLASRAKHSFYFGSPKISQLQNYVCFDCIILREREREKNNNQQPWNINTTYCFILSSSLLSFNGLFAPYNSTWKNAFIICWHKWRQHTKPKHVSRPVFSCCAYIPSHSFKFCHAYDQ